MDPIDGRRSRREVLAGTGTLAAVGLAGCLGDGGHTPPEPDQQLPTPVAGDPEAAVTVATFEDFTCPGCANYSLQYVPRLWSDYVEPGEIRYEWYDFPVRDDEHAWLAADAARSVQANADDPMAFWDFQHELFEHQDSLSLDRYEELANDVSVDGDTVRQETEERTYEPTVVASKGTGEDRGVGATPTIVVNDEMFEAPSYEELVDAIDAAIESA